MIEPEELMKPKPEKYHWKLVLLIGSLTFAVKVILIRVTFTAKQTSDSSWEFLKTENKQVKTVQNDSYE